MASQEVENGGEQPVVEPKDQKLELGFEKKKDEKKRKRKLRFLSRFGCFKTEDDYPTIEKAEENGSFEIEADWSQKDRAPTHLVVMVNGIIGSADDWRYAAKQFVKAFPQDVLVHCSESNYSTLTFDGIDVTGKRLADEVTSVVQSHPHLKKISFVGHSLGGLIARYAIAKLYGKEISKEAWDGQRECQLHESTCVCQGIQRAQIAGLEPINFITSATPHLGSSGHKQVPIFCGLNTLEKVASRMSCLLGRTGRHLFMTDSKDGKPPILLQMVNDYDDLPFISALKSFKRRVAYANARFDHIVGWSTSSLRHVVDLPKRQAFSKQAKYPHIVYIEAPTTVGQEQEISLKDEAKEENMKTEATAEEFMIRNLTQMSWERVDVSFSGSRQRFLAHNTIQVQNSWMNSDGADVIQHMIDNFLL